MALPTYTWYVHDVEVYCPIRHASGVITEIRFHVSKLSDFDNRMKKMAFLRCPAQLYGFRSEIVTSSCLDRTTYVLRANKLKSAFL